MPSQLRRRLIAGVLSLSLLGGYGAFASDALGWNISGTSEPVNQGLTYSKRNFWSDTYKDLRTEQILEYRPNADVVPVVSYGDNILSRHTLSELGARLEADGNRVVGGINGDFYVLSTGAPLGVLVTEGEVRSSSSYHYAAGFKADGTVIVGQPNMTVNVGVKGMSLAVLGGLNKVRNATDGYFLLTPDFHANSQLTGPGIEVVLRPVGGESTPAPAPTGEGGELGIPGGETGGVSPVEPQPAEENLMALRIGETRKTEVVEVRESGNNNPIPSDCYILTIHESGSDWHKQRLLELTVGEEVDISVSCTDAAWNDVEYAVGAMWKLLTNGAVESGLSTEQTARTAIGLRPDGSAVFYTIDGRQSGLSVGANLTQVANRLKELGCTEAIGLDGGGSTTFGTALPYESNMTIKNSPSDGSQRRNTNAVFFVSNLSADGNLAGISLHPESNYLLAGAATNLTVRGYDGGYYSTTVTGETSYTTSAGSVTGNRVTMPGTDGTVTVTANNGGMTAGAELSVVKDPDEIRLYDEISGVRLLTLNFDPGETLDIKANALKYNTFLTSQDTCYTWTVTGDCGTIDQNGVFTASDASGAGTLTVTAGSTSLTMDINVIGRVELVDDLDAVDDVLMGEDMTAVTEKDLTQVRFGEGSLRLDYEITDEMAYVSLPQTVEAQGWSLKGTGVKNVRYVGLWVYGDGSGNTLSLIQGGDDMTRSEVALTTLDFTGWKHILLPKPAEMTKLYGFMVNGTGGGTIWLDQLTISSEAISDTTAPVMTLEVADGIIRAVVADNVDKELTKPQISLTLDGIAIDFQWNQAAGTLTATLPESTRPLRRVRLTATDASGNIGAAGLDVTYAPEPIVHEDGSLEEVPNPQIFVDMSSHWAKDFGEYLYYEQISTGVSETSGLYYYPDRSISRQEFFTLAARFAGVDLNVYAEVILPFADTGEIADWALPAVKAMYSMGYLKGSAEGELVYAFPSRNISRAEAMTILGRMQPMGYTQADLSGFTDGGAVAAWAAPYVQSLVGQGIVSGYGGYLNPGNPITRGEVAKILTYLN